MWKKLQFIFLSEWNQSEKNYMLFESNYMTFWKSQNYRDSKTIRGCQRFWGKEKLEWTGSEQVDFRVVKLHDTGQISIISVAYQWTHGITAFAKTHVSVQHRVSSNINYVMLSQ